MDKPTFNDQAIKDAISAEESAWQAKLRDMPLPTFEGQAYQAKVTPQEFSAVKSEPKKERLILPFRLIKWGPSVIRIVASTLNLQAPTFAAGTAFPDGGFTFTPSAAGVIYAHVEFDGTTGLEITRALVVGVSTPADDTTNMYRQIGSWSYASSKVIEVANDAYGPMELHREPINPPSSGVKILSADAGDFEWIAVPNAYPCEDGVHGVDCCGNSATNDGKIPLCGGGFYDPDHGCATDLYLKSDGSGGISCGRAAATTATANTLVERDASADIYGSAGYYATVTASPGASTWCFAASSTGGNAIRFNGVDMITDQGATVTSPTGGATVDAEARTAIDALISRLQDHGLIA